MSMLLVHILVSSIGVLVASEESQGFVLALVLVQAVLVASEGSRGSVLT